MSKMRATYFAEEATMCLFCVFLCGVVFVSFSGLAETDAWMDITDLLLPYE